LGRLYEAKNNPRAHVKGNHTAGTRLVASSSLEKNRGATKARVWATGGDSSARGEGE